MLTFSIKPKEGVTFFPKTFSFEACRWGTDGGKYDVVVLANGDETILDYGVVPERNNVGFTSASYDLAGLEVGSDGMELKIKVYALAAAKEYGFANIVVTGNAKNPSDDNTDGVSAVRQFVGEPKYYTIDGWKVGSNAHGLVIVRNGDNISKIFVR